MSSNQHLPAALGGRPVVAPPAGAEVEWGSSRWGVEPVFSRIPQRGEATWPSWPQFSERSLDEVHDLLDRLTTTGAPLGYLGPEEQALEARLAREIGPDALGRVPKVYTVTNGSVALQIAYAAIATKRFVVQHRPIPAVPTAVTAVRSFEATWTSMPKAGLKPVFVDVDRETGCTPVSGLRGAIDDTTVLISIPALYDRAPDVAAVRELADKHDVGFVLDCAHGHLVTWPGEHVSKYADITTISGQGSKIVTPGWEAGLIVVFDPMLAAIVAKLRNVGRAPGNKPAWWPAEVPEVAGENSRLGEIPALMLNGSFDSYEELLGNRTRTVDAIDRGLREMRGPWRPLPSQPELGGLVYKLTLVFDPSLRRKAAAWDAVGWRAAGRLLAEELMAEVAASYPPPWEVASEYHPLSRPWQWSAYVPEIQPERFPVATWLAASTHMLSHEFLAREDAAAQLFAAVAKLTESVDLPEVQAWAQAYTG